MSDLPAKDVLRFTSLQTEPGAWLMRWVAGAMAGFMPYRSAGIISVGVPRFFRGEIETALLPGALVFFLVWLALSALSLYLFLGWSLTIINRRTRTLLAIEMIGPAGVWFRRYRLDDGSFVARASSSPVTQRRQAHHGSNRTIETRRYTSSSSLRVKIWENETFIRQYPSLDDAADAAKALTRWASLPEAK